MIRNYLYKGSVYILLQCIAKQFNYVRSLNSYLKTTDGWLEFVIGFRSITGEIEQSLSCKDGKMQVHGFIPNDVDAVLCFFNDYQVLSLFFLTPNEIINQVLKNTIRVEGNFCFIQMFTYLTTKVTLQIKSPIQWFEKKWSIQPNHELKSETTKDFKKLADSSKEFLSCETIDKGVHYLSDPYLSRYCLNDFPRLKAFRDCHFNTLPEICIERPSLLTQWYRKNGFEKDQLGNQWQPVLRQAKAFHYLMANKKAIIRKDDLLAGTTTTKDIGVVIYPDAQGLMIWGELDTIHQRQYAPYYISKSDRDYLHHEIFPFWIHRNFREHVRKRYHSPLGQRIDERFVSYFVWKSVGISHTIPDYPSILNLGLNGISKRIQDQKNSLSDENHAHKTTLDAMQICIDGILQYALNLSNLSKNLANQSSLPTRKKELLHLAQICEKVPANPCDTLDEAVNAVWIIWIALHMENTNTGLSLGRLDQWLQPYFEKDMQNISNDQEKEKYIMRVIELIGCLFLRCSDHLPLVPDIGNYLFGGSSSNQAITLGGVTKDGQDAVNDMTYIFLKVTEMLAIKDPNVNVRYHPDKNSDAYLNRICEVNLLTRSTPSIHNDKAVFESLLDKHFQKESIFNWSSTGCVEPTLSGEHMGHTGSILFNLVAPLEMALNNGMHPLMQWDVGPKTGTIESMMQFEDFLSAFETQLNFLIYHAVTYNQMLAEVHTIIRPTPFLSVLIQGAIENGKDVTQGGARYNSSGTANIGLADVTDALLVIKQLVFDEKKVTFPELKHALATNFSDSQVLLKWIQTRCPKFGSGDQDALEMAKRVMGLVKKCYDRYREPRGGHYTIGFWSMSQHVAYGMLSGAIPSGRCLGKAFTPGLTPHPMATNNFLNNIQDVAKLPTQYMDNNIAFNVKIVPSSNERSEKMIQIMNAYIKTYCDLGGMQIQFNVVSSETLREAMRYPELYKDLMVRISGYNAYFVTLNHDMQIELIERAEYRL